MAIELNMRTKILAGVVVLAAAGAGAWFFLLQDEPPPPQPAATKSPAKPGADTPKAADAAKAAPDPAKPVAEKPAAEKPAAAKPIPTDPGRLIAEIVESSGVKASFQGFARGIGRFAATVGKPADHKPSEVDAKETIGIATRVFDADTMTVEVAARMKTAYTAERMTRLLEILRQPVVAKMVALNARPTTAEESTQAMEEIRKNPPSAARQKLIQTLDELGQESETGVQILTLAAREIVDAKLTGMQKAGARVAKEARQEAGSQIVAAQGTMRNLFRTAILVNYRDASDEELGEYLKYIDTDTGRWGLEMLSAAKRAAIDSRVRNFASEVAAVGVKQALAQAPAKAPVAEKPSAEAAVEKPAAVAAARAAPKEPPAYQRPANIRELYTRYNDLITATVMRDRAAVKELLDGGKWPDVRQADGMTPLMIAAGNGDADLVQMLLAKKADPNLRAAGGVTALSVAKEKRRADVVQLLERSGAKN